MSRGWWRLRAACGLAGPVAFTAAWAASTVRQVGYSIAEEHLSGLAAPDARDPEIMVAGFVALGACTIAFGSALEDALGGRARAGATPLLVRIAGTATVAAGLLRRDRMLLHPPDATAGQSWHNHGHDLASLAIYATLIAAPLVLAGRLRDHPGLAGLRPAAIATSAASTALLLLFWSRLVEPWNGVVQRVAVTVPLAAMAVLAAELLHQERGARPDREDRGASPNRQERGARPDTEDRAAVRR